MKTKILFMLMITVIGLQSQAQSCFSAWQYKLPIKVKNTTGQQFTDQEVRLVVNTAIPIGSGYMQADGRDIRFTRGVCCDPACFFIESGVGTASTVIWVKIPSLAPADSIMINMLYGNPAATAASDGECTFAFWEGFDSTATKFDINCGALSNTVSGGLLNLSWSSNGILLARDTFPQSQIYTADAMVTAASGEWPAIYWGTNSETVTYGMMHGGGTVRISVAGSPGWCNGHNWASPLTGYTSVVGIWSLTWRGTGDIIGEFPTIGAMSSTSTTWSRSSDLRLMIGGISSGNGTMQLDWIRARKYLPTDPTIITGTEMAYTPVPTLDLGSDRTICDMENLDAGAGFVGYLWSTGGSGQTVAATTTDTYSVTTTSVSGCVQTDDVAITVNHSTSATDTHVECFSYSWIDGITYTSSNTTATHLLMNMAGCDSLVTLNLTIKNVDNTTQTAGLTITSNQTGALYQWLDCNNAFAPIGGETGISYTATANGSYAVEVEFNGCTDTSSCVLITTVGTEDNAFSQGITISPNPTPGDVNIVLSREYKGLNILVRDITGRIISSEAYKGQKNFSFTLQGDAGVYFIEMQNLDGKAVFMIVKQ